MFIQGKILDVQTHLKPTETLHYTRISPHATLSVLRRALLQEKFYAYFERNRLRNHLS